MSLEYLILDTVFVLEKLNDAATAERPRSPIHIIGTSQTAKHYYCSHNAFVRLSNGISNDAAFRSPIGLKNNLLKENGYPYCSTPPSFSIRSVVQESHLFSENGCRSTLARQFRYTVGGVAPVRYEAIDVGGLSTSLINLPQICQDEQLHVPPLQVYNMQFCKALVVFDQHWAGFPQLYRPNVSPGPPLS